MKKSNKLRGLFYLGLIPIILVGGILLLILYGIIYGNSASANIQDHLNQKTKIESEHVCPKPERILIRDTVFIECKRKHFEVKKESPVSEIQPIKNDTSQSEEKTSE